MKGRYYWRVSLPARSAIVLLWLAATAYSARAYESPPPAVSAAQPESADALARQVYDIFRQQCIKCHGAAKAGGLDLRSEQGLRTGGTRGPVVVPHQPDDSPLFKYVSHVEAPFMPAGGAKLPDDSLELIRDWIASGASIATVPDASPNAAAAAAEMAKLEERPITAAERAYWAFVKPSRVAPPVVSSAEWNRNPVDAFLLSAMEKKGLVPAAPADKRTLVRRAYLDVLGLPPTPAEVEVFVNDRSADAWPRLVDRLLASPHYGERWARHWMDLVRYADSGGFEFDTDRPEMYRYRDYLIDSFRPSPEFQRGRIRSPAICSCTKRS